jgi:hypothetical protein
MAAKQKDTQGKPVSDNEAIPLHKRLSMGQNPETGSGSGKKTPA